MIVPAACFAVLLASCGGDDGAENATTTTMPATTTTEASIASQVGQITTTGEMCQALNLLRDLDLPPGPAYGVLYVTNLVDADGGEPTGTQLAQFGRLLEDAVLTECPALAEYGFGVLYWVF